LWQAAAGCIHVFPQQRVVAPFNVGTVQVKTDESEREVRAALVPQHEAARIEAVADTAQGGIQRWSGAVLRKQSAHANLGVHIGDAAQPRLGVDEPGCSLCNSSRRASAARH
jgi:hypothetical protein